MRHREKTIIRLATCAYLLIISIIVALAIAINTYFDRIEYSWLSCELRLSYYIKDDGGIHKYRVIINNDNVKIIIYNTINNEKEATVPFRGSLRGIIRSNKVFKEGELHVLWYSGDYFQFMIGDKPLKSCYSRELGSYLFNVWNEPGCSRTSIE